MTETAKKFVLVDGSNYIHRAFYALTNLTNSRGLPTNAIFGFTNMLIKLLKTYKPDYIAMLFDVKGPTFRHQAFTEYKATRRAMPEELAIQIPYIKEIVRGFSLPVIERQGVEADDIIGTMARNLAAQGLSVVIVSGDKDLMQLISPGIVMVDTMKDKIYDEAAVKERFGVTPDKVPEIIGLMGDSSDNIPGVPGIGPKTARELIETFGSVEGVLANLEKVRAKGIKKALGEYGEQARLSRDLAVIKTDLPLDLDLEEYRLRQPDGEALKALFTELEFSSLLQGLMIQEQRMAGDYEQINTPAELETLLTRLKTAGAFSLDLVIQGAPLAGKPIGLAVGIAPGEVYYLSLDDTQPRTAAEISAREILAGIAAVLSDQGIKKYGHDLKTMALAFHRAGIKLDGLHTDTMVAAYVLNPTRHGFDLAELARDYLKMQITTTSELIGNGARAIPFAKVDPTRLRDYCCLRADAALQLAQKLRDEIEKEGLADLFESIEMPLVSVLATMERKGVLVDRKKLRDLSLELEQLLTSAEKKIYQLAGERFNINSPKQLQVILYDRLKLPRGRKIKEGYSTDVDTLTALAQHHELPAEILSWRSMVKLKTTYIDVLPQLIHPETGRIHTSFNQTVTATGRLSSSNPNLQNIPIRTPEGKRIRQAFVAPPGRLIVSADYSQVELRVLAHLSGDKTLIDTFAAGEDIHSRTAAEVFGVFPELVTAEMRRQAKVINFGILYGMGAFSLARELAVSQKQAQTYIDNYFRNFRRVSSYLEEIVVQARKQGYVTTLFNRRRYLPEINSPNTPMRQFAERTAINTPIQGTAADLIKVAMVNIQRKLAQRRLKTAMILQVHDELVFEVPQEEKEEILELVTREMEGVMSLAVPLKVDIGCGENWDEAHS